MPSGLKLMEPSEYVISMVGFHDAPLMADVLSADDVGAADVEAVDEVEAEVELAESLPLVQAPRSSSADVARRAETERYFIVDLSLKVVLRI